MVVKWDGFIKVVIKRTARELSKLVVRPGHGFADNQE